MKVITKGKSWSKQITCKGCKALLEIQEDDLQHRIFATDIARDQYEEEVEGTFFVNCPECFQLLSIKGKDLPEPMKQRIRNK